MNGVRRGPEAERPTGNGRKRRYVVPRIQPDLLRHALITSGATIVRLTTGTNMKSVLKPRWSRQSKPGSPSQGGASTSDAKLNSKQGAANVRVTSTSGKRKTKHPPFGGPSKDKGEFSIRFGVTSPPTNPGRSTADKRERIERIVQKLWKRVAANQFEKCD